MDEDEFEKTGANAGAPPTSTAGRLDARTEDVRERIRARVDASRSTDRPRYVPIDSSRSAQHHGIVWVRASDLLSSSTGRVAGRGLDLEVGLARRVRRAPAATRRAIGERAAKLPPLSEFGRSPERYQLIRPGLGQR